MIKYIEVEWPEYQYAMNHPRWNECIFVSNENVSSSYMILEDIYNEVYNKTSNYEV